MSHPQIDIPCGGNSGPVMDQAQVQQQLNKQQITLQQQQQPRWNGLTIPEILEKVDLFNITVDDSGDIIKDGEKVNIGKGTMKHKVKKW